LRKILFFRDEEEDFFMLLLQHINNPDKKMPSKVNQFRQETLKQETKPKKRKKRHIGNPVKSTTHFFSNRKLHQIFGLFLLLLSVFLALSFISYLQTWKTDDTIFSRPFWDTMFNREVKAENFMGKIGGWISDLSIKKSFGLSAWFLVFVFLMGGLKLLWPKFPVSFPKVFQISLLGILWFSATFAYLASDVMEGLLPGWFGIYIHSFLQNLMGRPGTGLLLLFVLISFLIITGFFIFFKKEKEATAGADDESDVKPEATERKGMSKDGGKYNVEEYAVDDHEPAEQKVLQPKKKPVEKENKVYGEVELVPVVSKSIKQQKPVSQNKVDFSIENLTKDIEIIDNPAEKPVNKMSENLQEKMVEKSLEKAVQKSPTIERQGLETDYDPRLDLPHFKFPTIDLLNNYGSDTINVRKEELEDNKNRIVETLNHYQIQIQKIKATIGPTVTLYEIVPAPGIRISKIKNLEDDIALSLSALGIRIIAPIPGKGTVGIEVPNQNPDIVSMRSVLASEKFQNTKYDLPFGMGKTIANEVYIADLTKMPHILMAGATGQGKSVGLNAIIASFLYKKHPSELKFVMVDPKKVELTLFSKIERHYLAKLPDAEEAIITDTRKVVRTLNSLGIEMDTRYELLKDAQVRNIKEYNTKFLSRKLNPNEGHHFLPYIVVVIDEFADLIMTAGKEIEIPLTRLAQLARAVGIHLVIATQRPSVNIITGSIKANFPARLAFRVISKIDSRTILDSPGADQLIGRGDMLLSTGSELIRLQCAFIDTPEIDKVTEFIGSQRGYPDAYHLPEFADDQAEPITDFDPSERDALFEESARILVANQQGSTSLLQRKLKIGYNRAGRIIDQLEASGIVGPFEGSKAREVLIKSEIELEEFFRNFDNNR